MSKLLGFVNGHSRILQAVCKIATRQCSKIPDHASALRGCDLTSLCISLLFIL